MADRSPDPQLPGIAGYGHFNTLEGPADFNRILEACIRKIGWEG